MIRKLLILAAAAVVLPACTTTYVANEYPLSDGRIADFDLNGDVSVHNAYDEARPVSFDGVDADLQQITETFARQLEQEIVKNGRQQGGTEDKEFHVRATEMRMANRVAYLEGRIHVQLELGNGEIVSYERRNGSPADPSRVLNGTIARAVEEALAHPTVLDYLAE